MACFQVVDGGNGLQICRVATNIFNKQSCQPTGGGPPALGLSKGLIAPHHNT